MYKANPRVNVELRKRLPSPSRQPLANTDRCVSAVLPLSQRKSPVSHLCHRDPQESAGEMEVDLSPSRGSSPEANSCGVSGHPDSPDIRKHLVTTEDSFHPEIESSLLQSFDPDKNVSLLLNEVDALRGINKKLQEQLIQKECELQRRVVEEELRREQREAQAWERPTVVLEELLAAQKDRDQALMSRLLLANEERDEVLLQARRLQQATKLENLDLDSDLDVDELLQRICNTNCVQEIEQCGLALVQHVHLTRQRRNEITAEEMKAVMKERDGSVAKYKHLVQDLLQEQEQRTTKQLPTLQRESDRALEDKQHLEAELRLLQVNHRYQDLLTHPHSHPSDDVSESLTRGAPVTPPLQVQLQQLSQEKQSMEAELQRCQESEREAHQRVQRLERLVEVLRKKVGTGNLRAII
ncbi:mirror-image polydactyly gene 1 protein isoform X3 [Betta splendens]|uniref:Mirror-image polydactyly gene 1 protein isoform X3 n=1 Tax=Betta splendens TaxID=158456 RepID=A0A6P7LPR9_BETSP|nr:mirror-image polydactyly gene 1 protein isoform X3 [Betta splendens]